MSDVRIHVPDGLHTWGLEYNYAMADASSVAASAFVKELRGIPNWFHQCGADSPTMGYPLFEYFGPEPIKAVRHMANHVATVIGCNVVT